MVQRENDIGDRGAELISEALKVNSSVQELRLVMLPLFPCTLRRLSLLPLLPCTLRRLSLLPRAALTYATQGNNLIGDAGATALGEVLRVNGSLQKMFLVRPCVTLRARGRLI